MTWSKVGPTRIFIYYVMSECYRAISALDELERLAGIREVLQPGVERLELKSILDQLRLALMASASVSRVFWPVRNASKKARARATRLKELFGLDDDHPLASRRLRNSIEHFDERLDEWVGVAPRPYLTEQTVAHPIDGPDHAAYLSEATLLVYDIASRSALILGVS
jgi:hypothetical protein